MMQTQAATPLCVFFRVGALLTSMSPPQFDINDKKALLGEGSFGSVYKVRLACVVCPPDMRL